MPSLTRRQKILFGGVVLCFLGGSALLLFTGSHTEAEETPRIEVIDQGDVKVEDITPRNFVLTPTDPTTVQVTWETAIPTDSYLLVGTQPDLLTLKYYSQDNAVTSEHTIDLFNLTPGEKYYLVVISNGWRFGKGSEPLEFVAM